jgi:hypothetical protein
VFNDFFDTQDRHLVFFRPIVARNPGMQVRVRLSAGVAPTVSPLQSLLRLALLAPSVVTTAHPSRLGAGSARVQVLLFNFPGQAGTTWPPDAVLNNDYYAACVRALVHFLGPRGTAQFMGAASGLPFYCMGSGNGANVATCFAMRYSHEFAGLRALLLLNGFLHVDTQLAGVLHDCVNVFACSPPSRVDLPVYFFSRFLFSQRYIGHVGAALALNIYTAVTNDITNEGRVAICRGALAHSDLRTTLDGLVLPTIMVASTDNALVNVAHSRALLSARGDATTPESIHAVLTAPRARATLVWLEGGHELLQECKRPLTQLVEQLAAGFHDANPAHSKAAVAAAAAAAAGDGGGGGGGGSVATGVVSIRTARHSVSRGATSRTSVSPTRKMEDRFIDNVLGAGKQLAPLGKGDKEKRGGKRGGGGAGGAGGAAGDAATSSVLGGAEVKEYMQWRQRRNKKRMARLEGSAVMIQRAFRSHIARSLAYRVRNHRHALRIQRWWRGELGRAIYREKKRQDWAARLVQRHWRGHTARMVLWMMYVPRQAAIRIQRTWRGHMSRTWTRLLRAARHAAARRIQTHFRGFLARREAFRRRDQRIAATNIQRLYRGRIGRLRAQKERDRYLFSRSQSQVGAPAAVYLCMSVSVRACMCMRAYEREVAHAFRWQQRVHVCLLRLRRVCVRVGGSEVSRALITDTRACAIAVAVAVSPLC